MNIFSPKHENFRPFIGILLLLFLLFVVTPLLSIAVFKALGIQKHNETSFFISRLYYWIFLVVCVLYSQKIEKKDLLIWKDKQHHILLYPVFIIAIFVGVFICSALVRLIFYSTGSDLTSQPFENILGLMEDNSFLIILTVLTAGFTEELLFRGYLQSRIELLVKKPWLAIVLTSILFGLLHHGYGTLINVFGTFFISLVFCLFYAKFRSIKTLIMFHTLYDFLVIYIQLFKIRNPQYFQSNNFLFFCNFIE